MPKILIVDDEKAINDLIALNLKMAGYNFAQIYNGMEVESAVETEKPDLIILDVMLPGRDGFEIMDRIKKRKIPVIFLTAKASVADRVKGLEMGGEDYIVKPFEGAELIARIKVVLRRDQKTATEFHVDETVVNFSEHKVWVRGKEAELTNREFELLELLVQNKNVALSRETIIDKTWGYDFMGETRTVDVHIQRLRKKLNLENRIKTIYKFGYRLEV